MKALPVLTEQQTCQACGGGCCSFTRIGITWTSNDDRKTLRQHLDSLEPRSFLELLNKDGSMPTMRFYRVKTEKGHAILFECASWKDGRCGIYENRPEMCVQFKCPALRGEMSLSEFYARFPSVKWKRKDDVTKVMMGYIRKHKRKWERGDA